MNSAEAFQPNISVRNYQTADRDRVFDLLSFLPNLYPRSFDWLEQRLTDIEHQRAHCTVALINQHITGILIDTPKGIRCSKISTLYVRHEARSHGLGIGRTWIYRASSAKKYFSIMVSPS